MASFVYNKALESWVRGTLDMDSGTFKVLLATSSYSPSKDGHEDRADVTANEVANGNGYTTNGASSTITVTHGNGSNGFSVGQIGISLGGSVWTTSAGQTLTARYAVWYLSTGTAANDLLVAVNDFGSDQIASNGGTLTLPASTITLS